jgi:hypothetical protein
LLEICFAPSVADSFLFLTLTRFVVVFTFVKYSFALFTPPLGDYQVALLLLLCPTPVFSSARAPRLLYHGARRSPCPHPQPPKLVRVPAIPAPVLRRARMGRWRRPSQGNAATITFRIGTRCPLRVAPVSMEDSTLGWVMAIPRWRAVVDRARTAALLVDGEKNTMVRWIEINSVD